jgi:hypothetical protein
MNLSPKNGLVRHIQGNQNNPHLATLRQFVQRVRIHRDIKLCMWCPLRDIEGSTHDDHLVNLVIVQLGLGQPDSSDIGTWAGDDHGDFFPSRECGEVVDDGGDGGAISFGVGVGLGVPMVHAWMGQGWEVEDAVEA